MPCSLSPAVLGPIHVLREFYVLEQRRHLLASHKLRGCGDVDGSLTVNALSWDNLEYLNNLLLALQQVLHHKERIV